MTPLAGRLKRRIAATGPIRIAEYMATCLMDPEHGYYATRDPFGAAGDFTTAPEISQMFGEMIGLFLAQVWLDQGQPGRIALVEAGPGRGTLMADILRSARIVPGFPGAVEVHLIEASPTLRAVQARTLAPLLAPTGQSPKWHDDVASLPGLPVYAVANEFLDALPVRQFERQPGPFWRERQVALDRAGRLVLGLSPQAALADLTDRLGDTDPGDVIERCPALPGIVAALSERIVGQGGVALFIDYGGWHGRGDTLQALRRHRAEGVLDHPGQADLTAHVDFEAVAQAARVAGARTSAMTPQGVFLERLGITQRAQVLAKSLSGVDRESHLAAHRRLTHPDEMGSLFKTLAVSPPAAPLLPGLTLGRGS